MAPRTRRSQRGGLSGRANPARNENVAPLPTPSTVMVTSSVNTVGPIRDTARLNNPMRGKSKTRRNKLCVSPLQAGDKRTLSSIDPTTSMPQASGSKRSRIVGTSQSRPMPLMMAPESEMVNQHESDGGAIKGKGKQVEVQHAPSFDSGRADTTTTREWSVENFPVPEVDGHDGLTDFEDEDEEQLVDLALKHPARFAETMATERATWNGTGGIDVSRPMVLRLGPGASSSATPVPTTPTPMPSPRTRLAEPRLRQSTASPGTSGSATPVPPTPMPSPQTRLAEPRLRQSTASPGTSGSATPVPITPTPMPSPRTHLAELSVETPSPTEAPTRCATPESPVVTRSDTDLVFVNDSTRLLLKYQHPIIRTIVQKAIENLRATLVFQDAFPDGSVAFAFSKDALSAAAVSHKLGGGIVQRRLEVDDEYAAKLVSLPRARISLIRAEVKERCYAIVLGGFFSMASAHDIAQVVEKQLSAYTYTFPCVLRTNGMVRRSQPYRNDRIIAVVRDVYFTGGELHLGLNSNIFSQLIKVPTGRCAPPSGVFSERIHGRLSRPREYLKAHPGESR
ncbi:hypothetical protein EDB85DRAFT_2278775, partial [Lactarius pseudohatsudake]